MPAIGLGLPLFLLSQAVISVVATRQARTFGAQSPRVVGLAVFVLGVAVVFALGGVLEPLLVEVFALAVVAALQRRRHRRPAA